MDALLRSSLFIKHNIELSGREFGIDEMATRGNSNRRFGFGQRAATRALTPVLTRVDFVGDHRQPMTMSR
jgi:hypothetical protein